MTATSPAGLPIIIGNPLSPFVRKVLAVCHLKKIAVQIDPIVPFLGNAEFAELNPLRRIPVLIHGDVVLPDSTVIIEYLDEIAPAPSILPGSAADRARSRWLDEFADSHMAQVLIWGLFAQSVVLPGIFGAPRDLEKIARIVRDDVPTVMDILEQNAPDAGFIGSSVGLGDLSVASQFANVRWARHVIDATRWPKTMAWVARVEASAPLASVTELGNLISRQPPAKYRDVLQAAGMTVTPTTLATSTPVRTAMSQL